MAEETKPERLDVVVWTDKMEVTIVFTDRSEQGPLPTAEEVLRVLGRDRVALTEDVKNAATLYADTQLKNEEERFKKFVIAKGRLAEQGSDPTFTWDPGVAPKKRAGRKGEKADHYSFRSMIAVAENTVLGTIVPAVPARAGVDVFGTVLPPRKWPKDIGLHKTVRTEGDNPLTAYSQVPGVVKFEGDELRIDEAVEIRGDVDFSTGNVGCPIDITIGGAVLDNFTVKSTGSIKVAGPIQGATVVAGKDIQANGGVLGKFIGLVEAKGKITVKFAEEAHLRAVGDVVVASGLINSVVETESRIMATQASVRGGRLFAREGAEIGELGSGLAVPTRVAIGVNPEAANSALEVDDEIRWIEEDIEPLQRELDEWTGKAKRVGLDSTQKVRMRQLASEIEYLKGLIAKLHEKRAGVIKTAEPTKKPMLQITRKLRPGAQIQFGGRVAIVRQPISGPLRIEERMIDDEEELVFIDNSGNVKVVVTEPAARPRQRTRKTHPRPSNARTRKKPGRHPKKPTAGKKAGRSRLPPTKGDEPQR